MSWFFGFGNSNQNQKRKKTLEDLNAAGININVLTQVTDKYPSLDIDNSINKINDVVNNIKKNETDDMILEKHFEILSVPVMSGEAKAKEEVLAFIKDRIKSDSSSVQRRANAVREGGKRRARKSKTRKSKKSKRSRGTRRV